MGWFPWPDRGHTPIRFQGREGMHFTIRLAHPIGFTRDELWRAAPDEPGRTVSNETQLAKPEPSDEMDLFGEEVSEFDEESDGDHDLDFSVSHNFKQIQDSKAAQKQ